MTSAMPHQHAPLGSAPHARTQARRVLPVYARVRSALAGGLSALLAACSGPMLPFATDTPPLVLTTIAHAGIADGRARFREIFCTVLAREGGDCDARLWRVGSEPAAGGAPVPEGPFAHRWRILLVTGFGAQCFAHLVRAFEDAEERLTALGAGLVHVPVTAFGGVAQNAAIVRDTVLAQEPGDGTRLVLLGYSKGAADTMEALLRYPELGEHVAAFVSVAGAVNGSPLAEVVPGWLEEFVAMLPGTDCAMGDRQALLDLAPRRQLRAVDDARGGLPVPAFSLVALADEPEISELLKPFWSRLAAADPRNDGQMLWYDQILPESTLLAYLRGDHLAVAVPVAQKLPWLAKDRIDRNDFPRAALLEAILRYLDEALPEAPGAPSPPAAVPGKSGPGASITSTRRMSSPLSPTRPGRRVAGSTARS